MADIAVEGFSDRDYATTTSSKEKNLSDYERRYDKGTGEPIKDIIAHVPYAEDQEFGKSTINEKEDDDSMEKESEKKKSTIPTPSRISNFIGKRGILRNVMGVTEMSRGGILGKVRGRISGKTKGAIMGTPESPKLGMPKPFGGKFLDGSIKEALTTWIFSKSGVGVTQSPETKEAKEQKNKTRRKEGGSVVHDEEKFENKGLSVSW